MRALRFALARVTIEMTAPFSVGTGRGDERFDSLFVTDASGRPTIPGSSLAGVLRSRLPETHQRRWFGFQERDKGAISRVHLSWAQVHDRQDHPAPFLQLTPVNDPILDVLSAGLFRDHVRISSKGVADSRGKFDETVIPRGARFTFEIRVDGDDRPGDGEAPGAILELLLVLLDQPHLRLGGRTRRGLGSFKVIRVLHRDFDLRNEVDRAVWAKLPRDLHQPVPDGVLSTSSLRKTSPQDDRFRTGTLRLKAEDLWLIGGGTPDERGAPEGDKTPHHLPKAEAILIWQREKGKPREQAVLLQRKEAPLLLPATSLKGALRHRTAFHLRRLKKMWAPASSNEPQVEPQDPAELLELFGDMNNQDDGSPGRVFLSDGILRSSRELVLDHVSLDRFTGGPMDGLLFNEQVVVGGSFEIDVAVEVARVESADARKALAAALADLCEGRLPLGAASNRGHGYFRGDLQGPLNDWLQGAQS
jgi:CRISPR/Cas system CSM-associated protein Csm3 (group 7 of RAMP superfamily)